MCRWIVGRDLDQRLLEVVVGSGLVAFRKATVLIRWSIGRGCAVCLLENKDEEEEEEEGKSPHEGEQKKWTPSHASEVPPLRQLVFN